MLSDDYRSSVPYGPRDGLDGGTRLAQSLFGSVAKAGPTMPYRESVRTCASSSTVVIEYDEYGGFGDVPYRNEIAASFDIRDGLVIAYREYRGAVEVDTTGTTNCDAAVPVHAPAVDAAQPLAQCRCARAIAAPGAR